MSGSTFSKTSAQDRRRQAESSALEADRQPASSGPQADILALQRMAGNQAVSHLLRPTIVDSHTPADGLPAIVSDALRGGSGQQLDSSGRAYMESRFGEEFGSVKIHNQGEAAESAHALGARAYTIGEHVIFAPAQYVPQSTDGRKLLAHELTHVLQQRRGRTDSQPRQNADLTAQWESQADCLGREISESNTSIASAGQHLRQSIATGITPAPTGMLQGQFLTPLAAGGGIGGVLERDRRSTFAPGPTVYTDYEEIAIVQAIQAGWRKIAELERTTLIRATVDQRVEMLAQLVEAYWTGGAEEETIIKILDTTPSSDAPALVGHLEAPIKTGKSLIEELDRVVDFGNNLDLHARISSLRLRAIPAPQGIEALRTAPILPWHDVMGFFEDSATFHFWLTDQGKVRICYYRGTALLSSTNFASEIQQLPQDLFNNGYDYEPSQTLIIHDYDRGRYTPVMARDLLGYRNQGVRNFLAHSTEVASLALPGGAAKTIVGKVAMVTLERVLPALAILVDENRLNIVKWFPTWGPKMLYFHDL